MIDNIDIELKEQNNNDNIKKEKFNRLKKEDL
jgi:hypothetical protein